MAIPEKEFLVVESATSDERRVVERDFGARCFTTSERAPFGRIVELYSPEGARRFFGFDSDEYRFARKYFSFVSGSGTRPRRLSVARWSPKTDAGWIRATRSCARWKEIASLPPAELYLEFNTTHKVSRLYLPGLAECNSVTNSADTEAKSVVNILTRTLNASSMPFYLKGANIRVVDGCVEIAFGLPFGPDATDDQSEDGREVYFTCSEGRLAQALGLCESAGAVCSDFCVGETPVEAVARVADLNDNFGSFMFFDWASPNGYEFLPTERVRRIESVVEWNARQNYKYLFVEALPDRWSVSGGEAFAADSIRTEKPGSAICLYDGHPVGGVGGYDYDEFLPMAALASTDFLTNDATNGYMFLESDMAGAAVAGRDAEWWWKAYAPKNFNFYGQVQEVGRDRAMFMPGKTLNGDDISVYVCEMFLKERIATFLVNHFLSREIVRPTRSDLAVIAANLDLILRDAKTVGIVTLGRVLTNVERIYIGEVCGDERAAGEIEKDGYCLTLTIKREKDRHYIDYVLVYLHHADIRKIEGRHLVLS